MDKDNKVKSFFSGWFEEKKPDEEESTTEQSVPVVTERQQAAVSTTRTVITSGDTASDELDPKYMDKLQQVLEEANIPGVDYLEFAEGVRAALKKGKTKAEAFTDVFESFCIIDKKLSVTVLETTAKQYISIIEETNSAFASECDTIAREAKANAEGKLAEAVQKLDGLKSEERKLKQRLEEIQAERESAEKAQTDIENSIAEVGQAQGLRKNKMRNAADKVVMIIKKDLELISQYLKKQ